MFSIWLIREYILSVNIPPASFVSSVGISSIPGYLFFLYLFVLFWFLTVWTGSPGIHIVPFCTNCLPPCLSDRGRSLCKEVLRNTLFIIRWFLLWSPLCFPFQLVTYYVWLRILFKGILNFRYALRKMQISISWSAFSDILSTSLPSFPNRFFVLRTAPKFSEPLLFYPHPRNISFFFSVLVPKYRVGSFFEATLNLFLQLAVVEHSDYLRLAWLDRSRPDILVIRLLHHNNIVIWISIKP